MASDSEPGGTALAGALINNGSQDFEDPSEDQDLEYPSIMTPAPLNSSPIGGKVCFWWDRLLSQKYFGQHNSVIKVLKGLPGGVEKIQVSEAWSEYLHELMNESIPRGTQNKLTAVYEKKMFLHHHQSDVHVKQALGLRASEQSWLGNFVKCNYKNRSVVEITAFCMTLRALPDIFIDDQHLRGLGWKWFEILDFRMGCPPDAPSEAKKMRRDFIIEQAIEVGFVRVVGTKKNKNRQKFQNLPYDRKQEITWKAHVNCRLAFACSRETVRKILTNYGHLRQSEKVEKLEILDADYEVVIPRTGEVHVVEHPEEESDPNDTASLINFPDPKKNRDDSDEQEPHYDIETTFSYPVVDRTTREDYTAKWIEAQQSLHTAGTGHPDSNEAFSQEVQTTNNSNVTPHPGSGSAQVKRSGDEELGQAGKKPKVNPAKKRISRLLN